MRAEKGLLLEGISDLLDVSSQGSDATNDRDDNAEESSDVGDLLQEGGCWLGLAVSILPLGVVPAEELVGALGVSGASQWGLLAFLGVCWGSCWGACWGACIFCSNSNGGAGESNGGGGGQARRVFFIINPLK